MHCFISVAFAFSLHSYRHLTVQSNQNMAQYALAEHGGGKQLCFGIMWNDGQTVPHPPVLRALESTKAALVAAGHKGKPAEFDLAMMLISVLVVDWQPYRHREICNSVVRTLFVRHCCLDLFRAVQHLDRGLQR